MPVVACELAPFAGYVGGKQEINKKLKPSVSQCYVRADWERARRQPSPVSRHHSWTAGEVN